MNVTNAHDILTRNWYQKTGRPTSFWYVSHAIWYEFLSGTRTWYRIEHVLFSAISKVTLLAAQNTLDKFY